MSAVRRDALLRVEHRLTLIEERISGLESERRVLHRAVEAQSKQVAEVRSLLFQLARPQPPDEEDG